MSHDFTFFISKSYFTKIGLEFDSTKEILISFKYSNLSKVKYRFSIRKKH